MLCLPQIWTYGTRLCHDPAFKLIRAGLKDYRPASHEDITTFSSSFSSDPSQSNAWDKDGLEKKTCSNSKFETLEIPSQSDHNGCIIVRRVRAVSMRAPITVCDQQINAIVDSGAEVTVMSKELYYRLPKRAPSRIDEGRKRTSSSRRRSYNAN